MEKLKQRNRAGFILWLGKIDYTARTNPDGVMIFSHKYVNPKRQRHVVLMPNGSGNQALYELVNEYEIHQVAPVDKLEIEAESLGLCAKQSMDTVRKFLKSSFLL